MQKLKDENIHFLPVPKKFLGLVFQVMIANVFWLREMEI